jgi:hypothetical protein
MKDDDGSSPPLTPTIFPISPNELEKGNELPPLAISTDSGIAGALYSIDFPTLGGGGG